MQPLSSSAEGFNSLDAQTAKKGLKCNSTINFFVKKCLMIQLFIINSSLIPLSSTETLSVFVLKVWLRVNTDN